MKALIFDGNYLLSQGNGNNLVNARQRQKEWTQNFDIILKPYCGADG